MNRYLYTEKNCEELVGRITFNYENIFNKWQNQGSVYMVPTT